MLNIRVEKTTAPKARPTDETKLGFGQIFTDHMAVATPSLASQNRSTASGNT